MCNLEKWTERAPGARASHTSKYEGLRRFCTAFYQAHFSVSFQIRLFLSPRPTLVIGSFQQASSRDTKNLYVFLQEHRDALRMTESEWKRTIKSPHYMTLRNLNSRHDCMVAYPIMQEFLSAHCRTCQRPKHWPPPVESCALTRLSEVGETSRTQLRGLPARDKGRPTISKQGASNLSPTWPDLDCKNVSNMMLVKPCASQDYVCIQRRSKCLMSHCTRRRLLHICVKSARALPSSSSCSSTTIIGIVAALGLVN